MTTEASSTITESISITLNEAVGSATISPSGRDVCLAARNGLFIVDLDDPWATPRFLPYYSAIVSDVQWSPHPARAQWVVSTSGNKGLVWNLAASSRTSPIEHVTLGHERSITDINWAVFQPDTLATCGIDGNVLAYDLRQGGRKPTLQYCGWRHGATQVKFNRQNPNELASSHGEWLYVWDDRKGSHPVTTIRAHEQKIYGIDYSRKRKDSIVTCSLDHTVKYWTLDGLETIEEPDQVINTMSPVWRARHTPFGNGLVTLPQRSEYSVKIWAQDAPEKEVWKLSGHTDVVREFLWRTQGGNDANDDDRMFQLVTWGSDQQLLLTPLSPDVLASVGHVPHSPIEVRQTRRNAPDVSFREAAMLPKSSSYPQSGLPGASLLGHSGPGVSPTNHLSAQPLSASAGGEAAYTRSKMTPPSLFHIQDNSASYGHHRQPLSSTSRYGRSANSNNSASSADGRSPSLGTSPADSRGLYLTDRRLKQTSSSLSAENDRALAHIAQDSKPGGGAFMTRASGRKPGGQDAVSWMEGVRIVAPSQQAAQSTNDATQPMQKLADVSDDADFAHETPQSIDKDVVPLHEELTAIARALQSKVRFEKIAIPTRTLIVALYGPWAASGLSTFLRATFTFPNDYPATPLNIEIERSTSITNKARARILAGVRGLAARYANRGKNSLEPCLNCLMGGKVVEPDEASEDEASADYTTKLNHLLVNQLDEADEEVDGADNGEDAQRQLANRSCLRDPRRAGAVFSPNGQLFAFFLQDGMQTYQGYADKRGRSVSPSGEQSRPRRRRLFESFGVIPALQSKTNGDLEEEEEFLHLGQDEDSDEVLNIPSLLLARRGKSHAGSESVGTSQHLNIRLAGTGRAFNSRIYRHDFSSLVGSVSNLAQDYTLHGNLLSIITANTETVMRKNCSWLVQQAWKSLLGLAEASTASSVKGMPIRALFLGESMPEKVFMDMLDIFFRLGDVQMTGLLACLVELDRRTIHGSRPLNIRKLSRSPGLHGAVDYFSLKPMRTARPMTGPASGQLDNRQALITPTGSGLPLKSPKDWIASTSYGTQGSSAGSSTRGSSWANNLSTFFKSTNAEKAAFQRMGRSTSPSGGPSGHPSPASLSPAFVKRSTIAPLSELRKAGGIASGRPATPTTRSKTAPHVSFAAASQPESQRMSERGSTKSSSGKPDLRFVIHRSVDKQSSQAPSILLHPQVQAQLEYYRILYADLLHRLQLPHQRAQVLKLTRSVLDGTNKPILQMASGLEFGPGSALVLEQTCSTCGRVLVGRAPAYCSYCRKKRDAAPCAVCHLPLRGLVETCLTCLHTCHLSCLDAWRADEVLCPAACGCSCADFVTNDAFSDSFTETFKSPPIVT